MNPKNRFFEAITNLRSSMVELLVTAGLFALGIGMLSTGIATWLNAPAERLILISFAVCITSFLILVLRFGPARQRSVEFTGVIVLAEDDANEIIPVPEYEFSEDLARNLNALCSENKALARVWKETDPGISEGKKNVANELIFEAIEYFAISNLSLLLSEYFNDSKNHEIDPRKLVVYEREDVPRILLRNRFLEMFSRPMEEREAFMQPESESAHKNGVAKIETGEGRGRVVMSWGPNGEIFDFFELTLPKDTKIDRSPDQGLEISNPHFALKIKPEFVGYGYVLPTDFPRYYLGRHNFSTKTFMCSLRVEVKFTLMAFLSSNGQHYHKWIDEFLSRMERDFSFDRFLLDIGWKTAHSTAIAVANSKKQPVGKLPEWLEQKD